MIIFFAWVIFIWIAITVLIDVFRRDDLSGWGKAAWTVFIIVLRFLGVVIYLIVNHAGTTERRVTDSQQAQSQFDDYVRHTAGAGGAGERDRQGQAAPGQRHHHPGRVRLDQGQGGRRIARPPITARDRPDPPRPPGRLRASLARRPS